MAKLLCSRLPVCVNNNCWLSRLLILIRHFTHVQSFCPHLKLLPPSPPIIVIWWPVSWFLQRVPLVSASWLSDPARHLWWGTTTRDTDHNQSSDWARRVTTAPTSAKWGVNHQNIVTELVTWDNRGTSHTETFHQYPSLWQLDRAKIKHFEQWGAIPNEVFPEKLSTKKSILITFSWVKLNPLQRKNC